MYYYNPKNELVVQFYINALEKNEELDILEEVSNEIDHRFKNE